MSALHIGTSGWSYPHWRGEFYPAEMAERAMLGHYARHLASVEINSSFYRLPAASTVAQWRAAVPPGFVFAVKASRYITHMKKLTQPEQTLPPFLDRMALLGDRLGPLLFQLPPRWRANLARLEAFLEALGPRHRCAFEFRDASWHRPDTYALLARHGAAFCIFDLAGQRSPLVVSGDFVYLRLHGPAGPYQGEYGELELARWEAAITKWRRQGRDVYCYFDNDEHAYAVRNAEHLRSLLEAG